METDSSPVRPKMRNIRKEKRGFGLPLDPSAPKIFDAAREGGGRRRIQTAVTADTVVQIIGIIVMSQAI